jgi:hypothetical protein
MRLIIFLACLLIIPVKVVAQTKIPNGSLSVTYRQVENGEIGKGYHEVELTCFAGDCSLRTVTLNQCWDLGGFGLGSYGFIKVETSSTKSGDLKVIGITRNSIALEQRYLGTVATYRFSYTLNEHGNWGLLSLTDFSGVASKNSEILGKVIAWQLVPLRATDNGRFDTVKLDCPIRVAALPGK